jgi:hypothetical protein
MQRIGRAALLSVMPAYAFCLRPSGSSLRLSTSHHEFRDLGAAMAEAHRFGTSMIGQPLRRSPGQHGTLDIQDERGVAVARIMLAELA